MNGMTSRGETSGHTQRLRSGDLGALMRTGYHRTMEDVQARLEQLGFDDVARPTWRSSRTWDLKERASGSWPTGRSSPTNQSAT